MTDILTHESADGNATSGFLDKWRPASAERVNELFQKYIPEMKESSVGAFPIKEEKWMSLKDDEKAFIPHDTMTFNGKEVEIQYREDAYYNDCVPIKKDYVFGTGGKGWGYYHLLTKHSYEILNTRIAMMRAPRSDWKNWLTGKQTFTTEADKEELTEVGNALYHRSHSPDGPGECSWNPNWAADEINELCAKYIPEMKDTTGDVGKYPLTIKKWLELDGKAESGEPAFIPADDADSVKFQPSADYSDIAPIKPNYVFGGGPKGYGYYHLSTRHSYEILTTRCLYAKKTTTGIKKWLSGHPEGLLTHVEKEDLNALSHLFYERGHSTDGPNESNKPLVYGYGANMVKPGFQH